MEKIRLNLDAIDVESFAVTDGAAEEPGTVAAYEAGPTRKCLTPGCTSDCV